MRYWLLSLGLCFALCADASAQYAFPVIPRQESFSHPTCISDALLQEQLCNPVFAARWYAAEQMLYERLNTKAHALLSAAMLAAEHYSIPVVVHIIHDNGDENISDEQIQTALLHLNQAFRNEGPFASHDGVAINIEFCLAQQDPEGRATNGITRTRSGLTNMISETQDSVLKNLSRWDPHEYLNIWVVREITSQAMGSGVSGYAFMPSSHGRDEDGIVVEARSFGSSFDNSKVHIHEVGHYLGLYHTFEGGCKNDNCLLDGDRVCDTPPDGSVSPATCDAQPNTCSNDEDDSDARNPFRAISLGGKGDQPDMIINYMDYGKKECQTAFTQGQSERMIATLKDIRSSLLQSHGCLPPCTKQITALFNADATQVPAGTTVTFTNASTGATQFEWSLDGISFSTALHSSHIFNTPGIYTVTLIAKNGEESCTQQYSLTIEVSCPCKAAFTVSATQLPVGGSVSCTNTSTRAKAWEWFLDGIPLGTSSSLTHSFPTAGGYMLMLIAYGDLCSDTAYAFIEVGNCRSKRTNIWYFGGFAGVDFNTSPPHALTNGGMSTGEGCATICDENGNLLFYTNGISVRNRQHSIMLNGDNLLGNSSSTQSAIIVPRPGNDDQYYIFTVDAAEDSLQNGISYSLVDMTRNEGLGDVTVKNIPLLRPAMEKITAVRHRNGKDIWVIAHDWGGNAFHAYLVSSSGIEPAVISTVGPVYSSTSLPGYKKFMSAVGYLKTSPDGTRLALAAYEPMNHFALFSFDRATGKVSDPIVLKSPETKYPYGVEFSPDGTKLYGSACLGNVGLIQYNLEGDSSAIRASMQVIQPDSGVLYTALQLAPDGKIYVSEISQKYLHVINVPNAAGALCSYQKNALYLGGKSCLDGLPSFIQSYFTNADLAITGPENVCIADSGVAFSLNTTDGFSTWEHQGKAHVRSANNAGIVLDFSMPGTDTLIARYAAKCATGVDTMIITTLPLPVVNLGRDTALCQGQGNILLDAGDGPDITSYTWQDGFSGRYYQALAPGAYWVKVTNKSGCAATDTLIIAPPVPTFSFSRKDTAVCSGKIVVLEADPGYRIYRWEDGSDNRTHTIYGPGTYWVTVADYCGNISSDTIQVHSQTVSLTASADTTICRGNSLVLMASGATTYLWSPAEGLSDPTIANPVATPDRTTTYTVTGMGKEGCVATQTVTIEIAPAAQDFSFAWQDTTVCSDGVVTLEANIGYQSYRWEDGSGDRTHTVPPGTYWVMVTDYCGNISSDTIRVHSQPISLTASADTAICRGNSLILMASGATSYLWSPAESLNDPAIANPVATPDRTTMYTVTGTDKGGCTARRTVSVSVIDGTLLRGSLPDTVIPLGTTNLGIPVRIHATPDMLPLTIPLVHAEIRFDIHAFFPTGITQGTYREDVQDQDLVVQIDLQNVKITEPVQTLTELQGTVLAGGMTMVPLQLTLQAQECPLPHVQNGSITPTGCAVAIRGVRLISTTSLAVVPNPVSEKTSIEIHTAEPGDYTLTLLDLQGKALWREIFHFPEAGRKNILLHTEEFPTGLYQIVMYGAQGALVKEISIMH